MWEIFMYVAFWGLLLGFFYLANTKKCPRPGFRFAVSLVVVNQI